MSFRHKTSHHQSGHKRTPPSSQHSGWSNVYWITGIIGITVGIFWILRPVFALLAASAGIAYICDPLIDKMEARGFSRSMGISIVLALGIAFVLLFLLLLVPPVIVQLEQLSQDVHLLLEDTDQHLLALNQFIRKWTGSEVNLNISTLKQKLPSWIAEASPEVQEKILSVFKGLFTQGLGLINTFLNLLLLPIFSFYLLRDWDILVQKTHSLIPHSYRTVIENNMIKVDQRLNAFVRGQIKICLALAVLYSIGLLIVGIDLALPIGILSGLLFIIPYLGTIFGIISSILLALINFGFSWHVIGVIAVFSIAQMIEGYYLTPKIIGESVGLSPLVVMISLIVGASLMGIWGMFLAIPITAVGSVIATDWLQMYRKSEFFRDHDA